MNCYIVTQKIGWDWDSIDELFTLNASKGSERLNLSYKKKLLPLINRR